MGKHVVKEDERKFVPVEWGRTQNLFGPQNVKAKYLKIGITEYAPGTEHKLHAHPGQEEVIYILDGEGISRTEEGDEPLQPGAFVFIPANMKHATLNILKDRPLKAAIIKAPPGEGHG